MGKSMVSCRFSLKPIHWRSYLGRGDLSSFWQNTFFFGLLMISGHVRKVGHDFVVLFRCACGFSDPPKNRGKPGPEQHYRRVGEVSTAIYEDLWRTARVDLAWHENWFRYPHQETRYLKFWLSDIMCSLTFDKILWDHKIILLALLVDFGTTALYRERKDMYGFHGPPRHLAAQLKFLQTLFKLRSRLALPDEHMECIWRVEEQQWTCEGNEETQPLFFFSRLLLSGAYISVEQPKATTILWSFVIIYTQSQQTFPSFHVSWFQDFWLAQNSFQPRQPLIHTAPQSRRVPSRRAVTSRHAEADLGRGDAEHRGVVAQEDPALSESWRTPKLSRGRTVGG